jgi:hypothetical protein
MGDWTTWVKLGAELLPEVIGWIADLARGGDAAPGETVRRVIADRRAEVAANRAAVDAALAAKHQERTERGDEPTVSMPTVPTLAAKLHGPLKMPKR